VSSRSEDGDARSGVPLRARPAPGAGARRYRIGASGSLYIVTTAFLGIGAFNSQNNLLYWAFGVAIAGLIVSGVIGGAGLMALRAERLPVEPLTAGERGTIRYRLVHAGRMTPAFAISIGEARNARSGEHSSWRDKITEPVGFVSHLGPGQEVVVEAAVRSLARGVCPFGAVEVSSRFPFGLMRKSIRFDQPESVVVRPARVRLGARAIARSLGGSPEGTPRVRELGATDEPIGLREYVEGDSVRRIAWRASARLGQLVVRQHAAAVPIRVRIVLDLRGAEPASVPSARASAIAGELARQLAQSGTVPALTIEPRGSRLEHGIGPGSLGRFLDAAGAAGFEPIDRSKPESGTDRGGTARERVVVVRAADRGATSRRAHTVIDAREIESMIVPGSELAACLREAVPS